MATRRLRAIPYFLFFFALAQLAFSAAAPLSLVYEHRMDYNVVKDNLSDVGRTLDMLAKYIRKQGLKRYVILLGDSVMYSGPGGPGQSVSRFMDDIAEEKGLPPVFNLAIPAAQVGDFYTLLLMMDERGIATDYVVMNLIYAGFVKRDPDPPVVYWLERDLKRLDPQAFGEIAGDLERSRENKDRLTWLETFLEYRVYSKIPFLKYRDFVRAYAMKAVGFQPETTGDTRPWYEKGYLRGLMTGPVYERQFDASPLVLDGSNPNVAFLERIVRHQEGKRLLVHMSPFNRTLTRDDSSRPEFVRNMEELSAFLGKMASDRGFDYADLAFRIPDSLFSDHMHLVANGYKTLAETLWDYIMLGRWF